MIIKNSYLKLLEYLQVAFWKGLSKSSIFLPDKLAITIIYRNATGKIPNLKNPQTFNEKLQWLKLNDRKPIYTKMVDKYSVKEYASKIIGQEYIIPTLGVWEKFDDIDFNSLPNQFVLKTTHDSGTVILCDNKNVFNYKNAKQIISNALKINYYKLGREWPYKNVKPKIIAEKYLLNRNGLPVNDYKLLCFNGIVKCSFVCLNRNSKSGLNVDFYDIDWNKMPFERHYPDSGTYSACPQQYKLMIELAEKLAKKLRFVRIDFYEIDNQVFLGEITLYPGNGIEKFRPEEWDYKLGGWIELSPLQKNNL